MRRDWTACPMKTPLRCPGIAALRAALLVAALLAPPEPAGAESAAGWKPDVKPVRDSGSAAAGPTLVVPDGLNDSAAPASATDTAPAAVDAPAARPPAGGGLADDYCRVVVDHAVAAKLAAEQARAEELKKEIDRKIALLKEATAEQQNWLRLRREFQSKATDNLVSVYSQMDAEAAAVRLGTVGEEIAAAILLKLPAKSASAVLGEMQPDMAGRLTAYMAGAAQIEAPATPPRPETPPP